MKRKPHNPITKIRTGTGDNGTTFLSEPDVLKCGHLVEFVGDLDESCAWLGFCDVSFDMCFEGSTTEFDYHKKLFDHYEKSKEILFVIGAMVHSENARTEHSSLLDEYVDNTTNLLNLIIEDEHVNIEPLEGFIIPNNENGELMIARAVIRRAERHAVSANCLWAVPTLNVMSDFLFFLVWYSSHYFEQWKGIGKS